jgi:hypothetical protein
MNKSFDLVCCDNFIFKAKEEARKAAAANNAELQVKINFHQFHFKTSEICS